MNYKLLELFLIQLFFAYFNDFFEVFMKLMLSSIKIHQIFFLARDWSKRVTWLNTEEYPQ